jgi:hypothetical protein
VHVFIKPAQAFLACHVCGGLLFARREIKMTTTGMTFMDLDWLNKSAEGVICVRCGFVHTFMGSAHQFVDPAAVDPLDLPPDPLGEGPSERG